MYVEVIGKLMCVFALPPVGVVSEKMHAFPLCLIIFIAIVTFTGSNENIDWAFLAVVYLCIVLGSGYYYDVFSHCLPLCKTLSLCVTQIVPIVTRLLGPDVKLLQSMALMKPPGSNDKASPTSISLQPLLSPTHCNH